jgi:hypothetical protein
MAAPGKKLSPAGNSGERRAHDREPVTATSVIRGQSDSIAVEVEIRDFSPTGCKFISPSPLPTGARIALGLAGAGSVTATVVRSEGKIIACLFDKVLPQSDQQKAFTGTTIIHLGNCLPAAKPDERLPRHTRYRLVLALGALPWVTALAVLLLG